MITLPDPTARTAAPAALRELEQQFGAEQLLWQNTCDAVPTVWTNAARLRELLRWARDRGRYQMLFDLTAIDERMRVHRDGQPPSDFTLVYHLMSFERNADLRVKLPLRGERPTAPSITGLWPNANWYEREVWDLFGIGFDGHPDLRRILMPPTWPGHPLRKDEPARATELGLYELDEQHELAELQALRFEPEAWGLKRHSDHSDFLFLNLGPNHPSVHGVFRIVLQLQDEEIIDAVPDIGYHHRGAEKMGERQSWHSYIPYTDRIDYLGGVMNNLPYVLAVERLAGIEVPERARVIRILLVELFRIASHLVFFGTMTQDLGQLSPVFYMFTDRERVFQIMEAICGFRMHPAWFRIGGVAADLPHGWERLLSELLDYLPKRLDEYDRMVMRNGLFKARTVGIGAYTTEEALAWGVTGAGLRATGFAWDYRRQRPYGGYEQFEFEIPTGQRGDCYDRIAVRVEEMRQSLRIVHQCLHNMPAGHYQADHPLATPPRKTHTLRDIETLITHFVNVSWGPVIPPGEACLTVEATKGLNGYYLISDGDTISYRTRIRTPSFPHLQMIPAISRGHLLADLIAIIGSIDFVMADVDR